MFFIRRYKELRPVHEKMFLRPQPETEFATPYYFPFWNLNSFLANNVCLE